MKLTKNRILVLGITLVMDVLFFTNVDPVKSPSGVLFAGFALVAFSLWLVWCGALTVSRHLVSVPKGRVRKTALILTAVCVLLLALQSIGQLALKDMLVVLALAVLAWFYLSYSREKRT